MSLYIGIDPGASGGIAVLTHGKVVVRPLYTTDRDVWTFIEAWRHGAVAVLEKVSSMPEQGVVSTFKFGQSYGFLRGLLTAAGIPYRTVPPGVWQREFSLPTLKEAGSRTAKKNAHKARAQELFPAVKMTHAVADALLLAEWLRRKESR